ncbi:MAG: hypothetical protein L0323_09300 [Planctomycetes bacterium]|nr:hypothetical protein [Planctomycetota bacterium]
MKAYFPVAAGALLLPNPALLAQDTPCPPGTPIPCSYRIEPIPNGYATILGAAGTVVLPFGVGADDATLPVPFAPGFTFSFYCAPAASPLAVCTNGFANFGGASTAFNNLHPGDEGMPNNAIMPWHDDQIFPVPTPVPAPAVAYNFGFYGPGSLVVQWTNMASWTGLGTGAGSISYQAVLWSASSATPNVIEYRYDRSSPPPVMAPCSVTTTGTSTFAVSATIGTDNAALTPAGNIGVDATDRGAANSAFPPCDLRLVSTPFIGAEQNHSLTAALLPQEPFCHIEGLPGTVAIPPACAGTPCYDNEPSSRTVGAQIALPWKVNLAGRAMRHAQMDSNGYLTLGGGTFASVTANTALPNPALPEAMLAPFWDSLEGVAAPGGTSGMFYRVDGVPGCRVVTFEWHSMGPNAGGSGDCVGGAGNVSFQVKIHEGSAGSLGSSTPPCPYDVVVPGEGNDRIEYHYDHAAFVAGGFTATIGIENHDGSVGASVPGSPSLTAPPAGMKWVIDPCDSGIVRYYGDATTVCPAPGACLPELKTNGVPPRIGNAFGLEIIGGQAGVALLNVFFGPPLPGLGTPVPCGGAPTPRGTFWAPVGVILLPTSVAAGPGCENGAFWSVPIPPAPALVGSYVWAQAGNMVLPGPSACVELTEGAKIILGG